jgi:hypothetical protein
MNEAAKSIRQHAIVIEAALLPLKSQPREESLRRIEIIARENGRKPLLHGGVEVAGLELDCVLELAQVVELLLG